MKKTIEDLPPPDLERELTELRAALQAAFDTGNVSAVVRTSRKYRHALVALRRHELAARSSAPAN